MLTAVSGFKFHKHREHSGKPELELVIVNPELVIVNPGLTWGISMAVKWPFL